MGPWYGPWSRHDPPPWWPEGEAWPPRGRGWEGVPRRFRRRFLVMLAFGLLVVAGIGVALGMLASHVWDEKQAAGPPVFGPVVGVFLVGLAGAAIAYRRLARPVGDLLSAAERVGEGDYAARTRPHGPKELRRLMTTFNEMVDSLATTEAERRRFLADVTHELRTPLTVLQSEIEAQLDGIHPSDDAHLAVLLEETRVLSRLVEDLHTMALLGAGRLTLHREPTDAAIIVQEAAASVQALAAERDVTVAASIVDGLPALHVDATRLRQVLANLLTNAVRHTPPAGTVTASVGPADAQASVRFTVTDSGPGIPADQLPKVFDPFEKSADSGGSGLGLAIARDLVRAHGGAIEVANGPRGVTASFVLPVEPP